MLFLIQENLLILLEEVLIDPESWLPPLYIEIQTEGDREVSVINDKNVTDVDFNQD